jgi:hypothetical protein
MDVVHTFDDLNVSAGNAATSGVMPRPGSRIPSSGGSSPLFPTPLSAVSGLTRGSVVMSAFLCQLATNYCRGAICSSSGSCFCCKLAKECSIKYHRVSKVHVLLNHLYLQAPRVGQARLEPCLDASNLPSDVRVKD